MALREILSSYWSCFQALLFPQLEETIGALGERHQRFVMVLEWVRVETLLPYQHRRRGCPPSDRAALARAFIAKAVFALVSTRMLLDRLRHDSTLRRLCGWRSVKHIPSEATFSRAFAEFADSALPSHLHEALIKRTQGERLAGHISRDSTAIEGRERPTPKAPQPAKPKRRRGRPRKGEERPTEPRRLERQRNMTLPEMLADLPYACDIGVKRDAKGYQTSWSGYKLHIDAADGAIPVSCLLTSASLHDSQVAIPLATLTAERVRNLYDLMDSAYDAPEIRAHSPDSLLHWQAYCSGSGGYAIGFPSKHLSGLALEKSWYLAKCIYGHTEKYSVLTEVINSFLEEFRLLPIPEGQEGDLSKDLVWRFSQHLAQIGTVIKSDAFSAEAEWRLISPVVPDHDERLAFRSGIMGIVPYYRFPLLTELNPHLARCEDAQLVLRCGPTNERFQTQHAAQTILSRYLGGASYGGSDVPLRKS